MIDKRLIEQIVQEVIQALQKEQKEPAKPRLLLVGEKSAINREHLAKIEQEWSIITEQTNEVEAFERILFIGASQDMIVKGAHGIADSEETVLLSKCLLAGKNVSIIPEPMLSNYLFNRTNHNHYVKKLLQYVERLREFGAMVESAESFARKPEQTKAAFKPAKGKKKLLTQRDVQDSQSDEIIVCPDTIITPSARDAAQQLGKGIIVAEQRS